MDNDVFLKKAKRLAARAINESAKKHLVTSEEVRIVWFCRTWQGWKAIVCAGHVDEDVFGNFVEVTYSDGNADANCYVYKKQYSAYYQDGWEEYEDYD